MDYIIVSIALHLIAFIVSFYALSCIDFGKFIYKGKVMKAQVLIIVLSMGLGYLVAQFLLALIYRYY